MQLFEIVIISVVAIVLLHFTLTNFLSKYEKPAPPRGEPSDESHPARDEMLDFVRGHLNDLDRSTNPAIVPKGSNYYGQFHDSDVNPELTDLSKFFDIGQSVPDTRDLLREINGPECGPNSLKDCKPTKRTKIDPQSGNAARTDVGSDGTSTFMPDQWTYQNEKPMNGGKVDGVRGFDGAAGGFALYEQPKDSEQANFISSYPYQNTFFRN